MNISYEIAKEINIARTNPKKYYNNLERYKKFFETDKIFRLPSLEVGIKTEEGSELYEETMNYLETFNEISPLKPINSLFKIAKNYLSEIQKIDYREIGNINIEEIIKQYGNFYGNFSRIINFGYQDPELIICNFLTSDGDKNREERNCLLNNKFFYFGVAFGEHEMFNYCTVVVFCTDFKSKNILDDSIIDIENYEIEGI